MRLFLSLFVMLAIAPFAAQAQLAGAAPKPPSLPPIIFGEGNDALESTLKLQYQMQVLRSLIDREMSLNKMIDAGIQVGVTEPSIPPPDRLLCAQVPANIVCAKAYPDLYENFSLENPVSALPPSLSADGMTPLDIAMTDALLPQDISELQPAETLYWLDITCLGPKCSAIISPEPANIMARYRITTGDKLPDGATVDAISYEGVTLKRSGEKIILEPAPAAGSGGGATPDIPFGSV